MFTFHCFPVVPSSHFFSKERREVGSHHLQKEIAANIVDTVWEDQVLNRLRNGEAVTSWVTSKEQVCTYLLQNTLLNSSSSRNSSQDQQWSRLSKPSEPGTSRGFPPCWPSVPVPQVPAAPLCRPFANVGIPTAAELTSLKTSRPGSSNTKTPATGSSPFLVQLWPHTAWLTTDLYP